MTTGFNAQAYLSRELYEAITDVRVRQPAFADGEADRRARRRTPAPDGKLVILAADHPGRASLKIHNDPVAMADRHETSGPDPPGPEPSRGRRGHVDPGPRGRSSDPGRAHP
jgi:hypothetical protein